MMHPLFSKLIVGHSAALRMLFTQMENATTTPTPLLVQGNPGVGKELVAQAIHLASANGQGPWVVAHCNATAEDLIEGLLPASGTTGSHLCQAAVGGTLFLDDIATLTPAAQARLLWLLQNHDQPSIKATRFIFATSRHLARMVHNGTFREDLFHLVNNFTLTVPNLTARREDIPALAAHFMEKYSRLENIPPKTISAGALQTLTAFDWPGHVRQLENTLHRALLTSRGSSIEAHDLALHTPLHPAESTPDNTLQTLLHPSSQHLSLAEVEDAHIRQVVIACQGNMTKAAQALQIGRATLYRKIKDTGLIALPPPPPQTTEANP